MNKFMDIKTTTVGDPTPHMQNIISFNNNINNANSNAAENLTNCHKISGKNIKIICSSSSEHNHGSSKVKLKNIVDYKWEVKNYPGHLIAVHIDGKHIAYVIKVNNKQTGTEEGMVRVVNTSSGQRALIKGISGEVLDVQFAHIERTHILACIDASSLYVHKIDMLSENLICNLLLKIEDPLENYLPKYNKISWCPLFPSNEDEFTSNDDEDEDPSQLIVWSRGKMFQCFNVNIIINSHGIGKHNPKDISDGYLQSFDSSIIITWISLSPDGTTLSVGSEDGFIRFYQVYFHEKQPRCLHQWKPHNGQPISSFFFLDNYRQKSSTDTFWKHALTGANNNTEFKIWDCGTWECLQTLSFSYSSSVSSADTKSSQLNFTAEIDSSSSYLVLSNIDSRNLYILQIGSNSDSSMKSDKDHRKKSNFINICSISEYPISSPILSFAIVDTELRQPYKCNLNDSYLMDDIDDYDEDSLAISCVVIRLFVVQTKSVQECQIFYQPIGEFGEDDNCDLKVSSSEENDEVLVNNLPTEPLDYAKALKSGSSANLSIGESSNSTLVGSEKSTEESDMKKKIRKSPSPLISGITNLNKSQEEEKMAVAAATVPTAQNQKLFSQVNLMTPDSFSTSSASVINIAKDGDKKSHEMVNSDVLSTIWMLASVTNSQSSKNQNENLNLLNLVNNKIIEDQQKLRQAKSVKASVATTENKTQKFTSDDDEIDDEGEADDDEDDIIDKNNSTDNLTSGGSSPPSREVQEIMSLKDYETKLLSHFVFENEQKDKEIKPKIDKFLTASGITEVLGASTSTLKSQQQQLISKNTSSNSNKSSSEEVDSTKKKTTISDWPKVPDLKTVGGPTTEMLPTSTSLPPLSSTLQIVQSNQSTSNVSPQVMTTIQTPQPNRPDMSELSSKIETLIQVIHIQSTQIKSLEKEISDLKMRNETANKYNAANLQEMARQTERQIIKILEEYLLRFEKEHRRKFDEFLIANDQQNRSTHEDWNVTNQMFFNQAVEKFSNTSKIEIQRTILPVLLTRLDDIQGQMQTEVAKKLSTLEQVLRDTISHLCRSKPIIDTFGKSVLMGVQGGLQAAFIESMSSTLIPAYEKSSQNMFKQLHETFSVGIKKVMEQFDNYLSQMQPVQETTDELLTRISKLRENLDSNLSRQTQTVNENFLETKKEIKSLEINFIRHFSELIKKEIRKNFESHVASLEDSVLSAVRSQATTPAPSSVYDVQDQIKQLLAQGQMNAAFHQALLANDLGLVEYTLEKADYKTVFNPCCLEQTVLLSLIQQISADMSNHNDLKQKYLADGILNLNLTDPITKEHAPKVMKELHRNCQCFLSANPKSVLCSNIRMIMMAIQGMGYKFN